MEAIIQLAKTGFSSLCVRVQVMETAKALLDEGQDIPSSLMAKVIKFQLLQIKATDQQRRKAEHVGVCGLMLFE